MPSEGWLDTKLPEAGKPGWVSPPKSLDDISKDRQDKAMEPKPEPLPLDIPKPETVPFRSVANAVDSAAKALLDASLGVKKAENNLAKALLGVDVTGEKGREISDNIEKFKGKIVSFYSEMESLSKDMGLYKAGLPNADLKSEE